MDFCGNTRNEEFLQFFSIYIGLLNLQENREQSAQQEKILQEISAKFDRLERMVKELKPDGTLSTRNHDDG